METSGFSGKIIIFEDKTVSVNWQEIAFGFFGGLGLFLFSIKYMGDGLQQAAGDRLRFYIDKYTSNPFLGILVGLAMSALIQSSSGVTSYHCWPCVSRTFNLATSDWYCHGSQYRDDCNVLSDWF